MKATIKKIHPVKNSRNGNAFIRVEFQLEDKSWAKTDICPDYRNYQRWKNLLKVGTSLKDLELKANGTVNADSYPKVNKPDVAGEWKEDSEGAMTWVPNIPDTRPIEKRAKEIVKEGGTQQKLI